MHRESRKLMALASLALVAALAAGPAAAQVCTDTAAQVYTTMETIADLGLPNQTALMNELQSAMGNVAAGDTEAAIADLESFISKVEAQSGRQIPAEVAAELVAAAEATIAGQLPCACNEYPEFQAITDLTNPVQRCVEVDTYCSLFGAETGECEGLVVLLGTLYFEDYFFAHNPFVPRDDPVACGFNTPTWPIPELPLTPAEAAVCVAELDAAVAASGVTCVSAACPCTAASPEFEGFIDALTGYLPLVQCIDVSQQLVALIGAGGAIYSTSIEQFDLPAMTCGYPGGPSLPITLEQHEACVALMLQEASVQGVECSAG